MAAKLKVDQVESVDGSANITLNNSVTMAANQTLPAASLTGTVAANTVDSDSYVDGSIDTAHIAADQITSALIADDQIDSEHIVDGSIDLAHMSVNSIDSDQYVDGSIDTIHIADNQITLAKMASGTDGNIISYDASGNPVAIATGSDGEVLTSTGAGSPPAFETLPASGMEDLSPYFKAYATQQVPSSGVWTMLAMSEYEDSDSAFASNRFTVPSGKGGRYFVSVSMQLVVNASSRITSSALKIYKNGSATTAAEQAGAGMYMNSNGPHATSISLGTILNLSAADYIEPFAQVTSYSGAVSFGVMTFMGFKIGD